MTRGERSAARSRSRDASVPMDTIERAIKRGTGELEGVTYEEVTYEGYAPHGVAIYIEGLTDNRNRTGPEVRSIFSKQGGSIAEPGAVAWQFERKGIVIVPGSVDEDEVMMAAIDAGADDVSGDGEHWQVTCEAQLTAAVQSVREQIRIGYLRYYEAKALQEIARSSQHELSEQVTVAQARLKAGVLTNADVLRVHGETHAYPLGLSIGPRHVLLTRDRKSVV